jgi:hypothetical protein
MDFPYLAKVTRLNIAALAAIASAPPPPEPKVEGAVSTDTTIRWECCQANAVAWIVHWRRTDANQWQHIKRIEAPEAVVQLPPDPRMPAVAPGLIGQAILKSIRVDDWVFGVSSVSKDGSESPVASAVPGGAFKPYVAPQAKE